MYKHCWEILGVLIGGNKSISWNIAIAYLLFGSQYIFCAALR